MCGHCRVPFRAGAGTRGPIKVVAERARFELANGVRPLRHFQCRALDQTRRPLRNESILSALAAGLCEAGQTSGGSRNTARPTAKPIRPSTPITTSGKPRWMPTSVTLSKIPKSVTQPLQPRPKFIRLRIATTLLGPVSYLAATDDLRRLAAQPNVQ